VFPAERELLVPVPLRNVTCCALRSVGNGAGEPDREGQREVEGDYEEVDQGAGSAVQLESGSKRVIAPAIDAVDGPRFFS
jgi:hypothetical protein